MSEGQRYPLFKRVTLNLAVVCCSSGVHGLRVAEPENQWPEMARFEIENPEMAEFEMTRLETRNTHSHFKIRAGHNGCTFH